MNELEKYVRDNFNGGLKWCENHLRGTRAEMETRDAKRIFSEMVFCPMFSTSHYFIVTYMDEAKRNMRRVARENHAEAVEAYIPRAKFIKNWDGKELSSECLDGGRLLKGDAEALCSALIYKYMELVAEEWLTSAKA